MYKYSFSDWGIKISPKNDKFDIIAEIAKYINLNRESNKRDLPIMLIDIPEHIKQYVYSKKYNGTEYDMFLFKEFDFENYDYAIALQLLLLLYFKWMDNTKEPDNTDMTSLLKFHYGVYPNGKFGTALNFSVDNEAENKCISFLEHYKVKIDKRKLKQLKKAYNMDSKYLKSHADYL